MLSAVAGSTVTITTTASDPDPSDLVTLDAQGLPAGATLSTAPANVATATISLPSAAVGRYPLVLTAIDDEGRGAIPRGVVLDVTSGVAPAFSGTTPADGAVLSTAVGATSTTTVQATDADPGHAVTIDVSGLPPGATLSSSVGNPATATIIYAPATGATAHVALVATDSTGRSTTRQITLATPNGPPRFVDPTPADQSTFAVNRGYTVVIPITAEDLDGDAVTTSAAGLPPGASLSAPVGNPATAQLVYVAPQPDAAWVTLSARDSGGRTSPPRRILLATPNSAPHFAPPTPTGGSVWPAKVGSMLSLPIRAVDPDDNPLAFGQPTFGSVVTDPADPTRANYVVTPAISGDKAVTLGVRDEAGVRARSRTIIVRTLVPTALEAKPAVAELPPTGPGGGLVADNGVFVFNLSARLTVAAGEPNATTPIEGKTVVFASAAGSLCTTTTDASGFARCDTTGTPAKVIFSSGYTVKFVGDATHTGSAGAGGVVSIDGDTILVAPQPPPVPGPPTGLAPVHPVADFDGNGTTDLTLFRPSNGT